MKIIEKNISVESLGVKITKFKIDSSIIAAKSKPGQFVVIMVVEEGERIPLTIVDSDKEKGLITLMVQELGLTSKLLGKLKVGDSLYSLVGPLGHATKIENYGKVILVGGGVGIAEIYPVAKALKEAGNEIITILGAKTKDLLILEKELKGVSDKLYITTDDGSYGKKGFTTDVLKELLKSANYNLIYAVGPIPMMKNVSLASKEFGVKTLVSLNSLMVDASGMCGGCRVTVKGEVKFACVDGPEFDAHSVDWEELEKRNRVYEKQEKYICKLYKL
ncbi:MAG: sulfide/dihydroorotate dehydrogenase-like FAD/NAD-binding protein [Candidatus Omnitrophica bacterium]|jgi:ferredoxin--NADP+ reductase|nr:sulfide/dihydroorotate dehydrogenase-like FAD/NAD-binding protein [Candidatus Omnitrophota bacterium]